MLQDQPVGAASVEIDGQEYTFAGELEREPAIRAARSAPPVSLTTHVDVLGERSPYSVKMATSYFADLRNSQRGDSAAIDRLRIHAEHRDLTMGGATTGAEFAPPEYLRQTYVEAIRSSAPLLNLLTALPLPESGVSVVHPKITTGATVGAHEENGALSESGPATTSVTLPIVTVGGFVDVSTELLDRSAPGIDEVIATDLARAYFEQVDSLCVNGTGSAGQPVGLENATGETVTTFTSASPTFTELLGRIASAYSAVSVARKLAPDTVLMHPRRFAWLAGQVDTTGRPIVATTATGPTNAGALAVDKAVAEGEAGRILGMRIVLDPSITTTTGAGTNQDVIYVLRAADLIYHQSDQPRFEVFHETLSANLQVRLRIFGYSAFSPNARPEGLARITGTGLNVTI